MTDFKFRWDHRQKKKFPSRAIKKVAPQFYFPEITVQEILDMKALNPPTASTLEAVSLLKLLNIFSSKRKKPYCDMNSKFFAYFFQRSSSTILLMMKFLEKHKFIYRNTWLTANGRKRHIIPKNKAVLYRDHWIDRDCIPIEIAVKYCEFFNLSLPDRHQKILDKEEKNPVKKSRG